MSTRYPGLPHELRTSKFERKPVQFLLSTLPIRNLGSDLGTCAVQIPSCRSKYIIRYIPRLVRIEETRQDPNKVVIFFLLYLEAVNVSMKISDHRA